MKLRVVFALIPIVIAGCKTSSSNSSVESHGNPANQHRALAPIESSEAIRNLLSFGAADGLYNGTSDDAALCKLETTAGEGQN